MIAHRISLFAALAGVAVAAPRTVVALGMDFRQVDWLDGAGGYTQQNSAWGVAEVRFDAADAVNFYTDGDRRYAYVNLVTTVPGGHADNWAVQNWYVSYRASAGPSVETTSLTFDLGIVPGASSVGQLEYRLTFAPAPVAAPQSGAMSSAAISPTGWLFGGAGTNDPNEPVGGHSGNWPAPDAGNSVFSQVGDTIIDEAEIQNTGPIPDIDVDKLGCFPAAKAWSLWYMGETGLGPRYGRTRIQAVYENLYREMHASDGTTVPEFIEGIHQWELLDGNQFPTTRHDPLRREDWERVMRLLAAGADVEMRLGRYVATGRSGGHAVWVTKIVRTRNLAGQFEYKVTVVDDMRQGDGQSGHFVSELVIKEDGWVRGQDGWRGYRTEEIYTETPEPGTWLAVGAGVALVGLHRRRAR